MTLLGSIRRPQLQMLLTRYLSNARHSNSPGESQAGSPRSTSPTPLLPERRKDDDHALSDSEIEIQSHQLEPTMQPCTSRSSLLERIPGSQQLQRLFTGSSSTLNFEGRSASPNSLRETISPEQYLQWENEILDKEVDYDLCQIDPAPFQLVERTSLLKVDKLFALLNLSHAYVTSLGRLVGVVALTEIRQTVEGHEILHEEPHGNDRGRT